MIWLLLFALFLLPSCICELITVATTRGSVQGFDHDLGNDTTQRFYGYGQMFLGIPYAKAPLGEKRFTLPEDICQYNDNGVVHNATYYRPRCWQPDDFLQPADNMDEDCLFLNVYTPNISGNYPVMVYIHGGTFMTGGGDAYHWKGAVRNLVSRGVVVVTFNYRIGLIGFFSTFTERFPPNRGMYDQILALQWVNEEIENFGGDSNRITIFGQSAGAASVSDLSLSPLATGLFHQLIQSSGAADFAMETITDPRGSIHQDRAQQLCGINSTDWGSLEKDEELLDCLIAATPQELILFDGSLGKRWNVAIDGALMPDYPENLAKIRPRYPVLMGDMLDDFGSYFLILKNAGLITTVTEQTNIDIFQSGWPIYDDETVQTISDMTIDGYSNGIIPAPDDYMGWSKLITDTMTGLVFTSSIIRDAHWHNAAGNEDVWLFTLAYRSLLPFNDSIEGWIPVSHCADLPYLWFYPDIWETYNATDADFAVADYMGQLWTDFAKNGELAFPRAGVAMNYVEIDDVSTVKTNWRAEADEVYNKEFPELLGEWPPLKISDDSWTILHDLGEKVISKWNANKCPSTTTPSPTTKPTRKPSMTTRKSSTTTNPKKTTRKHKHDSSSSSDESHEHC